MRSSSEGKVSVLYARGPDFCIFFRFFTDIFFNKSMGNARRVCGGGGKSA